MLDEEAIAIFLPREPHIFGLDSQKECRRGLQKCIDWGLGDGNGGGVHLPEAIQRRAASDNPSTDSLYHKVNSRPPPVS